MCALTITPLLEIFSTQLTLENILFLRSICGRRLGRVIPSMVVWAIRGALPAIRVGGLGSSLVCAAPPT